VPTPSGSILEALTGSRPHASFRVKHVQKDGQGADHTIPAGWQRIGVLGTSRDRVRFWIIEPAAGEGGLYFEEFFIRGGFRTVECIDVGPKALAAFRSFVPR
jgi:hypothetical protein